MKPSATYRLQFRDGMTFAKAEKLVPYLSQLGISHLYASPIFSATSGSTHGYDVTDHNVFDPVLGGKDGFMALAEALSSAGIGLSLDIVPNHMAASTENPWWRDVLKWGQDSAFASHFDIDWSERLTVPNLGKPFAECLADGELAVAFDEPHADFVLQYYDQRFPIHPNTYPIILEAIGISSPLSDLAKNAAPSDSTALADALRNEGAKLSQALSGLADNHQLLETLHEAQPWRLTYWRDARKHLSYRRFFEVTGLVGVRVEDNAVFEDVHRLSLDLLKSGVIDGLRIDHVDGLADPTGYLRHLRERAGPDAYIVVEKILGPDESLPESWPISGTTGYEFIAALADMLSDEQHFPELEAAYQNAVQPERSLEAERRAAKLQILEHNLETELTLLTNLARETSAQMDGPEASDADWRVAITELAVSFDVYRTYVEPSGAREIDRQMIEALAAGLCRHAGLKSDLVDALARMLLLDVPDSAREKAYHFVRRFGQTTGPVMAKAIEDTLFYRRNLLIGLNEVGGEPELSGAAIDGFHAAMATRQEEQPHGLLATATHDTKRGEDARARLYTISESPAAWGDFVEAWRAKQASQVKTIAGGPAPDRETEWLIFQALFGVWPMQPADLDVAALSERFLAYLEKAMREAKRQTYWTEINEEYENAARDYAMALLEDPAFCTEMSAFIGPYLRAGALNSLAQTALKLFAPGIPDIYQGTETWDLSLVDPDNRRPPDFISADAHTELREQPLDAALPHWRDGTLKRWLLARGLQLRKALPDLLSGGAYLPIVVSGRMARHLVAFARTDGDASVLLIVPRLPFALLGEDTDDLAVDPSIWADTTLDLSPLGHRTLTDALTGHSIETGGTLSAREALSALPIAMFTSTS
ncbi:malto-oligosyltrehalose synthase [Devosia pacifica]|uniref:Malto-oligosyltrehalose synthase n=1 Tax=Devosia pacifica TaxID=1335967 RepID=A0A918S244_9HYPH|nr:malto-oligosyltrehalose synthase [Devosia pacifica]GHA18231.1 malto-oligosyltrehalose synthase [Devosia pacifica]